MTLQEAKEILKECRYAFRECIEKKRSYEFYTGTRWRDSETYKNKAMQTLYCFIEALKKAEKMIARVERVLECLPARERLILRLYYFQGKSWKEVASETGYSEDHVKGYLQNRALALFAAWWPRCAE